MKVRAVLRLLKDDNWYLVVTEGSHRQFKHPTKPGRVTVAGQPNEDVHPKTLKSILA
ncbi:MAG: type II toxin-antitoxin system HicA family toxin [Pyrinomonadaceae bacterium]